MEKRIKKSKKSIIVAISFLILVTSTFLGLTYAYYRTRVIGNKSEESISVTSKKLGIAYADNKAVLEASNVGPDEFEKTKEFTVSNTGDEALNYTIIFDNVENTFELAGWEYELKQVVQDETRLVTTGIINRLETQTVEENITIDAGTTDTYKITFRYVDTGVDQSDDMEKSLSLRINIREASQWDSAEEGSLLYAIKSANNVVDTVTAPGLPSGLKFREVYYGFGNKSLSSDEQNLKYYTYSSEYIFNESTGLYTLVNPKIGLYSEIYNDLEGKYVVDVQGSLNPELARSIDLEMISKIKNPTNDTSNTFRGNLQSRDVIGIKEEVFSSTEDDYGISYYYRGNVKNNYINFAGMCWKIVRIQGDGSIKIILEDQFTTCDDVETEITEEKYTGNWRIAQGNYGYENINGIDRINYLEPVTNAHKSMIKAFYDIQTTKLSNYLSKLKSGSWCLANSAYERTETTYPYVYKKLESNFYNLETLYYDTYVRLTGNNKGGYQPTLKCTGIMLDKFKKVSYNEQVIIEEVPMYVSTITADEVVFAGGSTKTWGPNYYLNSSGGHIWRTLSAYYYNNSSEKLLTIHDWGYLYPFGVTNNNYLRPAIILKNDVSLDTTIPGQDGTQAHPYVIS